MISAPVAATSFTWSDGAAWTGLGLSLTIAILGGIKTWNRWLRAEPVAWLEQGDTRTAYCVITNRGAAAARNVEISFTSPEGQPIELFGSDRWPLPLVKIGTGDVVYLIYDHMPGRNPWVLHVHASWKDRRPRRQTSVRAAGLRPVRTATWSPG